MHEHLRLATDPENCALSDACARGIIDDIVSIRLEVDLLVN